MNEAELWADRETGPARFLQDDLEQRPRRVASSVLSAVLLLLLVVGVPAGLLALDAAPTIPRSLPSLDALTGTIGVEQLLAVLVWIVWLAWLQFTICTVVELRSALSGVGLPARVPLAGPSQRLARTLVVSVLLLASAAGQASAAVAPSAPVHSEVGVAISAPAVAGEVAATVAAPAEAQAAQGETTYWLGDVQLSPEEGAELLGKRVYVVKVPDGRYHDNLWDIAERTLGDDTRQGPAGRAVGGRELAQPAVEQQRTAGIGADPQRDLELDGVVRRLARAVAAAEAVQRGEQPDGEQAAAHEERGARRGLVHVCGGKGLRAVEHGGVLGQRRGRDGSGRLRRGRDGGDDGGDALDTGRVLRHDEQPVRVDEPLERELVPVGLVAPLVELEHLAVPAAVAELSLIHI